MAEPVVFDHLTQIDASNQSAFIDPFDSLGFPDDFVSAPNFLSDLDFGGDVEFSIDDLLNYPDFDGDPPPTGGGGGSGGDPFSSNGSDSKEGSGVCSSSSPVSGNVDSTSSLVSRNSGGCPLEDSGNYAVRSPDSGNSATAVATGEMKLEDREERKAWGLKRKEMTTGDENKDPIPNGETHTRSSKSRRSGASNEANSPCMLENEEDEKRKSRLIRNRESAQLSRQRKKHYVEELEEKVRAMHSTISELNGKISYFMAENASLRQKMGGNGGNCPPPAVYPAVSPMGPMHYPWIPCLKPPGFQVPLIPIPRLRPQQPASTTKSKKSDGKRAASKTKKVASVSLLGLLSFMLLIGVFIPGFNFRNGGYGNFASDGYINGKGGILGQSRGRVLSVEGNFEGLNPTVEAGFREEIHKLQSKRLGSKLEGNVKRKEVNSQPSPGLGGSTNSGNASEPLLASLYVPRNDKLVKIDGNLIISSVLASERVRTHTSAELESCKTAYSESVGKETRLAIARSVSSALAVPRSARDAGRHSHMFRTSNEHQKALPLGSAETYYGNIKSTPHDGPLKEWFREGLEGPVFSSGMCTEVFQFDAAPVSGIQSGIIPSTSVANATNLQRHNSTHSVNMKNRRILYSQNMQLNASTLNNTKEGFSRPPENSSYRSSRPAKSMVVSVLVDPREVGDGDSDGMMQAKSISRIFVVVLVDSVKYITYSCTLPFKSNAPHLVTN